MRRQAAFVTLGIAVWLNAATAAEPQEQVRTVVLRPIACLELNASGTIVYNHCGSFLRFGWRNQENCRHGCVVEVAPEGFAVVTGLNGHHAYGVCLDSERFAWLGWRYSCYPRDR